MLDLPEVYQLEITRACNFKCPMCPTQHFVREDNRQFLELALLEKIIARGDLDESYFVELQMGGEPLLHPELDIIIDMVKSTGVAVGLSTNGFFIDKCTDSLMKLDSITVSVDSITEYKDIRRCEEIENAEKLIVDIKHLLSKAVENNVTVDLQVIELEGWEKQVPIVKSTFKDYIYHLRTIPDAYLKYSDPNNTIKNDHELCINPWMSVSVQCNGNVVPCCMSQGDDIIYGNLYEDNLRDIWANEKVAYMRERMRFGNYLNVCKKCYSRNPVLFHQSMLRRHK